MALYADCVCVCVCKVKISFGFLSTFFLSFCTVTMAQCWMCAKHHLANWMMTLYYLHNSLSNQMKHRRKKMNSSNHNNCTRKLKKKKGRGERKNASDINIMWVVFSQQFSDRWLGALLCIFADIWFAYWQQLTEWAATHSVCSSITSLEYCDEYIVANRSSQRLHVWVIPHI